ncbi:MAG: hypothetical protein ACJ8BW_29100 [Ktedonobacteraceae bacterium]
MSEDDTHFSHEDQLKQGYVFDPDSYPIDRVAGPHRFAAIL